MKTAVLFSGGKDSTFVLKVALEQGWDVQYLVTVIPEKRDSWMFHHPCIKLTRLQSQSVDIKHLVNTTVGEKEEEVKDLMTILDGVKKDIDAVVSGAISSRYQKDRIDAICKELDLKSITPLWGKNQLKLLETQIESNFKIIFTGVSSAGLDKEWLGREIDQKVIDELKELHEKYEINIAGEGGEYETLVTDCPIFRKKLILVDIDKIWDKKTKSGYIICKKSKLVNK